MIGGNFSVLAVDIFKQVIGQQNFNKGAVVSIVLLLPVLVAFVVDWIMQGKQQSQFSARAVPYAPKRKGWFDALMFAYCTHRRAPAARGAGDGRLHVVHQALAVRSRRSAFATTRSA